MPSKRKRSAIIGSIANNVLSAHFQRSEGDGDSDSSLSGDEFHDAHHGVRAETAAPPRSLDSQRDDVFDLDIDSANGALVDDESGAHGASVATSSQPPPSLVDDKSDEEIASDGDESDAGPDPCALLGSDNEDGPPAHSDAANIGAPESVQIAGARVGAAREQ